MKSVRLGIIGLGNMGVGHADNIVSGKIHRCEITAVCDPAAEKAARYPKAKSFTRSDELVRSGLVDAVVITTPHFDHTDIGIAALQAGLHVLVEKPISVHKADCEKLIAAWKNPKLVFAVMFQQRTDPCYQKIRELIQKGELGQIRRINWIITNWFRTEAYYKLGSWRATWAGEGGGVLLNQCPHNLDLFQWFFGMPKRVRGFCSLGRYHDIEVEDDVTAYFEYADGATAVFITSTGEAPGHEPPGGRRRKRPAGVRERPSQLHPQQNADDRIQPKRHQGVRHARDRGNPLHLPRPRRPARGDAAEFHRRHPRRQTADRARAGRDSLRRTGQRHRAFLRTKPDHRTASRCRRLRKISQEQNRHFTIQAGSQTLPRRDHRRPCRLLQTMKINQVAAQLYTVRDFAKTPAEIAATLKKIRAIGYESVQLSGLGPMDEKDLVALLKDVGLTCCATHEDGNMILNEPQSVVEKLKKLGCNLTAYAWPGRHQVRHAAGSERLRARLNAAGKVLHEAGQVLCYHNHQIEFRRLSGKPILEILFEETDPRYLLGEPDTYWVQNGGGDPVAWCNRLKGRLPILHMKDYTVNSEQPTDLRGNRQRQSQLETDHRRGGSRRL